MDKRPNVMYPFSLAKAVYNIYYVELSLESCKAKGQIGKIRKIYHATLSPSNGNCKVEQGQDDRSSGTVKKVTQYSRGQ